MPIARKCRSDMQETITRRPIIPLRISPGAGGFGFGFSSTGSERPGPSQKQSRDEMLHLIVYQIAYDSKINGCHHA